MTQLRRILCGFLGILGWVSPRLCYAQFIGYTSPQTVQQTLTSGTACTPGVVQTFLVPNLGQTEHSATIKFSGVPPTLLSMEFDAVDNQGNQFPISDSQQGIPVATTGEIQASGYYPQVLVVVTCEPNTATYTINYSGTSSTPILISGSAQQTQQSKLLAQGLDATQSFSKTFRTPFGSSSGYAVFSYSPVDGPSGSTLAIGCIDGFGIEIQTTTFDLVATAGLTQSFPVGAMPCNSMAIRYTPGGGPTVEMLEKASSSLMAKNTTLEVPKSVLFDPVTASFTLEYIFNPPGLPSSSATVNSTVVSGQQSVTTSAAALASMVLAHGICVQAFSTNTESVFIGGSGVTTSTGIELPPKAATCLAVGNANAIFVVSASGG